MSWLERLRELGWRVADEREYYAFLGERIIKKTEKDSEEDQEKERLINEMRRIRVELSLCAEYIVPISFSV